MKRANLVATACFTTVIGALALLPARAQDSGAAALEKSILTFSAPVELPKITLQPGTYVFKRPDANSARIIQVFTEDEKQILGTFLTVPAKRLEVSSDNVVTFKETREGQTPAVHYWYYPARETGHEFVYPKDQAMRIAARTGEKVLSTEGDLVAGVTITEVEGFSAGADTDKSADVAVNRQSSASTSQPVEETQIAANQDAPAAAPAREMPRETVGTSGQADAAELPQTASPLPLSGLIGLLSFGGVAILRRFRQ